MTDRKLMQQALEALEQWNTPLYKRGNIINTLRERLAQTEPEPVTHTLNCVCGAVWDIKNDKSEEMVHTPDTSPPPQRKPLHDMAVFDLADQYLYEGGKNYGVLAFARAIEAALRSKNNGT